GFETKAHLMRFDTAPMRGITVERAWINVFLAGGDLYGAGFSTVLCDTWEEGAGVNGQRGRGGASWNWAVEPENGSRPEGKNYWSWPGSGIYSVSWAHPDARYCHAGPGQIEKKVLDCGIVQLRIPVAPRLVEALAAGLAGGLVMTDDKGQVTESLTLKGTGRPYTTDNSRQAYLYTADIQEPSLRPFLEVEGEVTDHTPPGAVGKISVVSVAPNEQSVTVAFTSPGEDGTSSDAGEVLGFEVRYLPAGSSGEDWQTAPRLPLWAVPKPEPVGARQLLRVFTLEPGAYYLAVCAVDEAGNRGPVSRCKMTVPELQPAVLEAPVPETGQAAGSPLVFEGRIELWACSDLCKVDPLGGGILLDGQNYEPAGRYKLANPVWSASTGTVSLEAMRGEVVACQLVLSRIGDSELTGITVSPGNLKGRAGVLKAEGNIKVFRTWYLDVVPRREELIGPWELVEDKGHRAAWHADACLPLGGDFAPDFNLPTGDNIGPAQRCQTVWIDFFIPRRTKAGIYEGRITISAAELEAPVPVTVRLKVLPLTMPGEKNWLVDLNAYHYGISSLFGVSYENEYERFLQLEQRLHQMAQAHRATLNLLPYGQSGSVPPGAAPELTGSGRHTRIASWKRWDHRFSRYLNGKAFTRGQGYRGPSQGVPVTNIYLPFHENWPMPIREHYSDWAGLETRAGFAEWAKKSGPLEEAFDKDYQEGFISVVRQFFEHLKKKKFTRTNFQAYFNNKYYFKVDYFGIRKEGGVGSSFWLLDEPVDYDDYAANRFFLSLVKTGHERARVPEVGLHLRTDVSQPEMTRGLWDGICNFWTTGGLFPFGTTAAFRMKRIPSEQYIEYGGGPQTSGRLLDLQALFFSRWVLGAVGQLPYWDTLRGEGWFRPSNLAIFYTGTDYARSGKNYDGPVAGVRLKAMRRAQQDIEYLNMLAASNGWDRPRVRRALKAWADKPREPAATFGSISEEQMFQLRKAVVAAIMAE
ncbi:MAG: hypothetical protein U9P14_00760, partial [Gemmatimonadota bacterium]|nr:hypothetical protein [Gemmatimonadota bacterium]